MFAFSASGVSGAGCCGSRPSRVGITSFSGVRSTGVLALERRNRLNGVRAPDGLHARFGEPEVLHFTLLNQFLHRARDILDRHVWIHTVLIQQVDGFHLSRLSEPSTAFLMCSGLLLSPGSPFMPRIEIRTQVEPEFRCNHDLSAKWRERLAHEFFV